ncbi:MFS transporter [Hoeflea olei]|uniref:MFS transporter n=1 Tax=Hoeflea olei TaxID=1480615 RepID=A0A1C1YUQ7_9HYPH|nr:MFS transporter [Hoeflea olei]OCW57301.1 MFS transporter [Hoeflea olei]
MTEMESDHGADLASGWGELLQPQNLAATTTLCLGVGLFAFNEFFISTALPTAVGELGGAALLSWALTLYLVFAIVGGMMAADMKRRFGARATLLAAAGVFVAGTLLAVTAGSMVDVLAGRLLQGAGEGVVAALCYALIPELFPSRLVPKVFGAEAMVWALAAFGGPVLAGALTEYWSWRAAFFISVPAAAIFAALVVAIVPRRGPASPARTTIPFSRLFAAGTAILMISVSGTLDGVVPVAGLLAAAGAILVLTVRSDIASSNPVLPSQAFWVSSPLGAGLWVVVLMPLAHAGTSVFLVYALQHLWDLGPTAAGALSAVMAVSWSSSAIVVASLRTRTARHRMLLAGPVLLTAGLAGLTVASVSGALWLVLPAQIASGAGFGFSWGTLSQLMMEVSDDAERDRTSAMLPTLQSAGYAIGAAVFGLVANTMGFAEDMPDTVLKTAMLAVFAGATLVAAVSILFGLRMGSLARAQGRF